MYDIGDVAMYLVVYVFLTLFVYIFLDSLYKYIKNGKSVGLALIIGSLLTSILFVI